MLQAAWDTTLQNSAYENGVEVVCTGEGRVAHIDVTSMTRIAEVSAKDDAPQDIVNQVM